jgi:acetolactate synthase-1/2/3 large subunit
MELAEIPSVHTLMGKGAVPDNHKLNLGMLGMHGHARANYAAHECDLLIAIGMRFSDRVTGKISSFAPEAKIIHIDVDPAEIGKMIRPLVPIVGDARNILMAITEKAKECSHKPWIERIAKWRAKHITRPSASNDGRIEPEQIFNTLNEVTGGNAIIATDVGQHQMWTAQLCHVNKPRHFLSSGGLGTMGFGLPAAIGAQTAYPDRNVFLIAGDGSILMNNQELMTAVEQKLPVKILLFNNGYLGMVRQWQQLFYDRRYASTDITAQPDFLMLARAYGAEGIRVTKSEDIRAAIEASLKITDRPCLIDLHVAREANVVPMIPTGGSVEDMLLHLD